MGYKSRGNFQVNCCLRKCANRDILCKDCWRWNNYVEDTEGVNREIAITDSEAYVDDE